MLCNFKFWRKYLNRKLKKITILDENIDNLDVRFMKKRTVISFSTKKQLTFKQYFQYMQRIIKIYF